MQAIALNMDINKTFDISFEDGAIKREDSELSFAKHNLYCFGRIDKNSTINPVLRRGFSGSFLEDKELFSKAWFSYMEEVVNINNIEQIIQDFNSSCNRDFKAGLIEDRIKMKDAIVLDKNTISFRISIGETEQNFLVKI